MPEQEGTITAIQCWEKICQSLVKLDMAELFYDGSKFVSPSTNESSSDFIKIYHLFVGSGKGMKRVVWRFHYDERPGIKSHLRYSDESVGVLLKSMTIVNVLQKLNVALGNNEHLDSDKLLEVMNEALVILAARKKKKLKQEAGLLPDKEIFIG